MAIEKDFEGWHGLKQQLDTRRKSPIFHEREIWWCSVGVNVGFEVYGKGKVFTRPVLIVKKFSPSTFLGVPLSTKTKENEYYYPITFKGNTSCVVFDQIRTFDAKRLLNMLVKLPETQFSDIKQALFDKLSTPYK
jgi:mRNA interferase MazF